VDLDEFIVEAFCTVDDALKALPAGRFGRQRGPAPILADSEVLTLEVVGEFLGFDQDTAIYRYFRRHYGHFFPALRRVHRTTFVRQAANLWATKEWLWQSVLDQVPHDPAFALVDSFPLPVCQFARARRCRRFRGEARFGKDFVIRQTFYGFRLHVRLCWPGVISRISLAPANVWEPAVVPLLAEGTYGLVLGDRNYDAPRIAEELASQGVQLLAPPKHKSRDPHPSWNLVLSHLRYRIDTVFGQLVERYHAKRIWARDAWHLWSRLLRKVLSHTLAVLLNQRTPERLQLASLLCH
jgi:Transposase DDE domain